VSAENDATILRFRFTDWRGITVLENKIGPGGVMVEATNGKGKTSFVSAFRAVLSGKGVDAAAVRVGAEQAELLVDLRHATVRRVLKANGGGSLKITRDDGTDQPSPQAWLNDLFGISPLDPIELFEEKDAKKRRARILAAMPIAVTPEVIAQWLPEGDKITAAECAGHGLDVIERVHKAVYERRTEANREAKGAKAEHTAAALKLATAREALGPGEVRAAADLDAALREAERTRATLESRVDVARSRSEQNRRTRERIETLKAQAAAHRADAQKLAPRDGELGSLCESRGELSAIAGDLQGKITELQHELDETMRSAAAIDAQIERLEKAEAEAHAANDKAIEKGAQADELEASISDVTPPTEEELKIAAECVAQVRAELARSEKARAVTQAEEAEARAKMALDAADAKAKRLDASEKALKNEAPGALLAASNGVPGLTIDGETIRLDGVALETLSGAEQLTFAVDIAKRLNAKSKLLVIDRLEAVAPDKLEAFLAHAREGGFQLICTRVADGEMRATPIGGA
jgi:predicted  nucleic acid-binding Zn-ribbon protein